MNNCSYWLGEASNALLSRVMASPGTKDSPSIYLPSSSYLPPTLQFLICAPCRRRPLLPPPPARGRRRPRAPPTSAARGRAARAPLPHRAASSPSAVVPVRAPPRERRRPPSPAPAREPRALPERAIVLLLPVPTPRAATSSSSSPTSASGRAAWPAPRPSPVHLRVAPPSPVRTLVVRASLAALALLAARPCAAGRRRPPNPNVYFLVKFENMDYMSSNLFTNYVVTY